MSHLYDIHKLMHLYLYSCIGWIFCTGGVGKARKSQVISDEIISQKAAESDSSQLDSDSQIRKRNKTVKKTADRTLMISDIQTLKSSAKGDNSTSGEEPTCDKVEENGRIVDDSDGWNKNQQTILEWALRQYPKGVEQRWEKIAEHIPGKSKVG